MSKKSVSVIIVNYNGKEFIAECIDSVLQSDYPDFEIIIVDNASTDESTELLCSLGKPKKGHSEFISESKTFKILKRIQDDTILKIILSDKNLYFTGGCNLGAKTASGEKLIFLNSDTVVEKNWLKELLNFAGEHKKYLIQPKILIHSAIRQLADPNIIDSVGGRYIFPGIGFSIGRGKKDYGQYNKNEKIDYASGTCFMIDKNFFWKLDGLDEWYKFYYEDVDLSLRATKQDGECWYCYQSIIYHKGNLSFKGNVRKELLLFNIRKNRLRTIIKNFTGMEKFFRIFALLSVYLILAVQDFLSFRRKKMFLTVKSALSAFTYPRGPTRSKLLLRPTLLDNLRSKTTERPAVLKGITLARYKFATCFIQSKSVLDIGTGLGNGAYYLAKKGAGKVLGIDNYKPAINYARKNFIAKNLNFKIMDASGTLPLRKHFNVVTAFEIIEHLPLGSYSSFIHNLKEILTLGGICLISTPNKLVSSPNRLKPNNPYHAKEFTPEEFVALIKKSFSKVELLGIKCTNREFLGKDKLIKRKLGNRFATFLAKYKITHELLPLIPNRLRKKFTSQELLPPLKATDFRMCKQNIDKCEALLVICKNEPL